MHICCSSLAIINLQESARLCDPPLECKLLLPIANTMSLRVSLFFLISSIATSVTPPIVTSTFILYGNSAVHNSPVFFCTYSQHLELTCSFQVSQLYFELVSFIHLSWWQLDPHRSPSFAVCSKTTRSPLVCPLSIKGESHLPFPLVGGWGSVDLSHLGRVRLPC